MQKLDWETVEKLTKYNLVRLAEYYGVDVKKKWSKDKILSELKEKVYTTSVTGVDADIPEMSVRVRRIYDSQKRGE